MANKKLSLEGQKLLEDIAHAMTTEPLIWNIVPGEHSSVESYLNKGRLKNKKFGPNLFKGDKTRGEDTVRAIVKNSVDPNRIGKLIK